MSTLFPTLHPPSLFPTPPRRRWRGPALACLFGLLLAACGGGGGQPDAPAGTGIIGRVETTAALAGAAVQVHNINSRTGASQVVGEGTTSEAGLFSIEGALAHDGVRVTAQAAHAKDASSGQLSAYAEAGTLSASVLHVNAVSTLVDRVRRLGSLPLPQAQARVAAYLELGEGASTERSFVDGNAFDHAVFSEAQQDSGLDQDGYLDRLAAEVVSDPQARRRFVRPVREAVWDDPPMLQTLPFAGDIAAAAAKGALNKAAGSDGALGSVLSSIGFGTDAKVLGQLREINLKLTALQNALDSTQQLVRESKLEARTTALKPYVKKITAAQARLEAIASYSNPQSRAKEAEHFNDTVSELLQEDEIFSLELLGTNTTTSLVDEYIRFVWSDPSKKFYSWKDQERILSFIDYYDALNGSLYLLYANYYRGLEVADPDKPKDYSEILARHAKEFTQRRSQYLQKWPERLNNKNEFIGKVHKVVYSGVRGYGPGEKRFEHMRQLNQSGEGEWFMPTTKYYEQQQGIRNATGQKVTQWLYRDFLEYAKSRNQSIGKAVVAAGAPAMFEGTGQGAIFLLNEDLQEYVCEPRPGLQSCATSLMHTGYVVFDLANPSRRDYKVRRPTKGGMTVDMSQPVPGNYHYIYARELTQKDRQRWKIPAL